MDSTYIIILFYIPTLNGKYIPSKTGKPDAKMGIQMMTNGFPIKTARHFNPRFVAT